MWLASTDALLQVCPLAPSIAVLRSTAPSGFYLQHKSTSSRPPAFSTNEFARLIAMLIDRSAEIRQKVFRTGQDLTRDELVRAVGRDAVWEEVIAPRFNDESVIVTLNLARKVDDVVDASAACLAVRRREKLLNVFKKNKTLYTKMYRSWTVSGSNDADCNGDFVNVWRTSGAPTEDARRPLITFHALRRSTPDADTDLLGFTMKTVPGGVSYDDNYGDENAERRLNGSSRKNHRMEEPDNAALITANNILKDGMSAVVQSLTARSAKYDDSAAKRAKDVAALTKELVGLHDLLD